MPVKTLARNFQRVERMKIQCNKLVDRIEGFPDHDDVSKWRERYAGLVADIERTIARAEADENEKKEKEEGVNIDVPLHKFGLAIVMEPTE